ncbi:hypothetical protein [Thermodesulfatator atlanticus]|uniref:hypothetical protein n=1 Tax=Thermodesulfatator atlanticus TaxID=501497 RepID=UPI0003B70E21|nr:hypothetical protein [Thermodesulfatator atlanticus]
MVNGINQDVKLAYQVQNQTKTQTQEKNQISTKPQNRIQSQDPATSPLQTQTQVKNQIQDQVTIQNKILQQSQFQTEQKVAEKLPKPPAVSDTGDIATSELNGLFRVFLGDINRIFHKALSLLKGDKSIQRTLHAAESLLSPSLNKGPRSILREFNLDLNISDSNTLDFSLNIEGTSVWKGQAKSVSLSLEIHLEQVETTSQTTDTSEILAEEVLNEEAATQEIPADTIEEGVEPEQTTEVATSEAPSEEIASEDDTSSALKPITKNIVDTGRYFVSALDQFTFDIYDKKNGMCTRFCAMSAGAPKKPHTFRLQIALLDATQVRFSYNKENNETSLEVNRFQYTYSLLGARELKEAA